MKKNFFLYLIFSISSLLYSSEYNALLSPFPSGSNYMLIIYEGNSQEEILDDIDRTLTSTEVNDRIKLTEEFDNSINNVVAQRKIVEEIITFVKDIITVVNLKNLKPDKVQLESIIKLSIDSFTRGLKQAGIEVSDGSLQIIIDTVVTVIAEIIADGADNSGAIINKTLVYLNENKNELNKIQ